MTGKANVEVGDQKREVELKEGKIEGDTLTFVETFKFQDNEIRIEYQGKLGDNDIKFTRKVGDFATEEFVAKRVPVVAPASASSTNAAAGDRPRRGPGGFGGPIVLGPDDKPAFADAPTGFNVKREDIAHGRMEMIEYDSKTVGTRRKMLVYTPPGYPVQADREHRALAGLSMGGGQSLNFGLGHLDTFAWVGAFSPAPNTKAPELLVPDPASATQKLKLLWLSCGNKDGLISISRGVHTYLKEKSVPHVWHMDGKAADMSEWRNNLYLFSQRIFR